MLGGNDWPCRSPRARVARPPVRASASGRASPRRSCSGHAPARRRHVRRVDATLATIGATDPFAGCTADNAAGAGVRPRQRPVPGRGARAAGGRQPDEPAEHRRRLPRGPLVRRRRPRPRQQRHLRRRRHLDAALSCQGITKCSGGKFDRASDPWVSFGRERHAVRDLARVRRVRHRQRDPRFEVVRRRHELVRADTVN